MPRLWEVIEVWHNKCFIKSLTSVKRKHLHPIYFGSLLTNYAAYLSDMAPNLYLVIGFYAQSDQCVLLPRPLWSFLKLLPRISLRFFSPYFPRAIFRMAFWISVFINFDPGVLRFLYLLMETCSSRTWLHELSTVDLIRIFKYIRYWKGMQAQIIQE